MKYKHSFPHGHSSSLLKYIGLFVVCVGIMALPAPVFAQEDGLPSELDEVPLEPDSDTKDVFDFDTGGLQFEKTSEELEQDFRREAFKSAMDKMLPLKPSEIRELLERYDRTIESTNTPVYPYPRPISLVENLSLDPGSPAPVIRLSFGYVTSLSILDNTGKPWPIEDMSWVGDFLIEEESPRDFTNMVRISPEKEFAHGNVSMRLVGLDTPVVFTLETARDSVHYRFDAIIPQNGPYAQTPLIDSGIKLTAGDSDMSLALSGVIPQDAEILDVNGTDGRTTAYIYNGMTYVRTPLALLSPAWDSSVTSADGTKVYALEETPVVLLSDKGRMMRVYLSASSTDEDMLDE
ncbi:MAG: DotH/IcmK family type IV secretion protein [Alphaproteobacteria bacterium]|nr:DotH/IcmK family type IV secretion protein [Alphaproteobacteria bacterium]